MPKKRASPLPPMKVVTFMLADHAEAVNGKLYVTGGNWNQIFAPKFPARHNHLSIALAIQVPWIASNEKHSVELLIVDPDENSILPTKLGGEFEVGRPPGWRPGDDHLVVVVFNINGMSFPKAGRYSVVAKVDDQELGRLPFSLVATEAPVSTG